MELNGLERDFLSRLAVTPWTGPPLLARLLEEGLVTAGCAPSGAIWYEITDEGRNAIRKV